MQLLYTCHLTEYSAAKTLQYPNDLPQFQNCMCCVKYLKNTKHNSLHLAQLQAWIFDLGHLFLEAHSVP